MSAKVPLLPIKVAAIAKVALQTLRSLALILHSRATGSEPSAPKNLESEA